MSNTKFVSEFDDPDDYEDDRGRERIAKDDPFLLSRLPPNNFAGNSLYYIGTAYDQHQCQSAQQWKLKDEYVYRLLWQ